VILLDYVLGCIPSSPDNRDFLTTAMIPQDTIIPSKVFWKPPLFRDQGNKGTCVGFGNSGLKNIHEYIEGTYTEGGYSPLFIYSICKTLDGKPNEEGTQIRIALQVLKDIGVIPEVDFPYESYANQYSPFPIPTVPETLKTKAFKNKIASYARIPDKDVIALKQALVKSPVVAGLLVTSDFVNAKDGFVGTPNGYILGGHCVLFCGYDDSMVHTYSNGITKKGFIIFQNSWGDWGNSGLGYIAYEDISFQLDNGQGYPFIFEMWMNADVINTPQPSPNPTPIPIQKYYKVQVGAFSIKTNAYKMVEALKAKGFPTYIPPIDADGLYRIQVGAFTVKTNAEALKEKLALAGFNGFIVYK
jgi:hypothetical protein